MRERFAQQALDDGAVGRFAERTAQRCEPIGNRVGELPAGNFEIETCTIRPRIRVHEFGVKADGEELQVRTGFDERMVDAWRKYEQPSALHPEVAIPHHEACSSAPHEIELGLDVEMQWTPVLGLIAPSLGTAPPGKGKRLHERLHSAETIARLDTTMTSWRAGECSHLGHPPEVGSDKRTSCKVIPRASALLRCMKYLAIASIGALVGCSGGSSPMPPPSAEPAAITDQSFTLAWEDQFDTIDTSRWSLMTHSWDGNLAQFAASPAEVVDGRLKLNLTPAPEGSEKPYLGVEYRSKETLQYGKVEARARFAKGSAVVSSIVLIYTPWPPDDWNELDIEFLGKNTDRIQFNHMINIPPADPISGHRQYPELVALAFDPGAEFHDYAIEWVPGRARFSVDGQVLHETTEEMARMVLPQNILLTIWASSSAGWAGPVDGTTSPTSAEYDWIKVYNYTGN